MIDFIFVTLNTFYLQLLRSYESAALTNRCTSELTESFESQRLPAVPYSAEQHYNVMNEMVYVDNIGFSWSQIRTCQLSFYYCIR